MLRQSFGLLLGVIFALVLRFRGYSDLVFSVALVIGSLSGDFISRIVHIRYQKIKKRKVQNDVVELSERELIRATIRKKYTTVLSAKKNSAQYCKDILGYPDNLLGLLPKEIWCDEIGAGCPFVAIPGSTDDLPRKFAGRTVVDLGCGVGTDCFLAAQLGAQAYGFDMTPFLVSKAIKTSRELGLAEKVSFILQTIDEPLTGAAKLLLGAADFVLTNGVINLCVKDKAFANAFALLKPGGWFLNADVVLEKTFENPM